MTNDLTNPTAYLQEQFGAEYEETEQARKTVAREAARRRFLAYSLKGIAVLGGVVLAAGLVPPASQFLGFAIATAVAIDGLFSNHMRLVTTVRATQAYRRLLRAVTRTHQRQLAPILVLKTTEGAAAEAERQLNELNSRLLGELHAGAEQIETALDEADLKALLRLSVEPETAGPIAKPPG